MYVLVWLDSLHWCCWHRQQIVDLCRKSDSLRTCRVRILREKKLSGSISQRYGSAEPHPHPGPYKISGGSATLALKGVLESIKWRRPGQVVSYLPYGLCKLIILFSSLRKLAHLSYFHNCSSFHQLTNSHISTVIFYLLSPLRVIRCWNLPVGHSVLNPR
jgi:hypothetical protein